MKLTAQDLESERVFKIPTEKELLELLIENKPISYLMTHSYTYHTRVGRELIQKMQNYYYERISSNN